MTTTRLLMDIPSVGTGSYAPKVNDALQRIDDALPVFPVTAFGAVSGGAAGSAKTAVLAAINAAKAAPKGGTVYFAEGSWQLGDLAITLPDYSTGKLVHLDGAGIENTILNFTTDRGPGTWAIKGDGATTLLYFSSISNMRIVGPGSSLVMGTPPANMSGIRWDSRMTLFDVDIVGFRAGVESSGNHCRWIGGAAANCFYGLYFNCGNLAGDIGLIDVNLGGNTMASIGIAGGGAASALASFAMWRGHLGFGPYAIHIESTATGLSMGSCQFYGTSWEFLGNGAIYSEDQTATVRGLVLVNCGNFSQGSSSYKIAARGFDYMFRLATLSQCRWLNTGFEGVPAVSFIDCSVSIGSIVWEDFLSSYLALKAASKPVIVGPALALTPSIELRQGVTLDVLAVPASQFFAVVAGQLLEWRDLGHVQPYGSQGAGAKGMLAGVALNGVAASAREYVLVARRGFDVTVLADSTTIGVTDVLVPSTANSTKVVGLQWDGTTATLTKPLIGRPYTGNGTGGTVRAHVNIP